MLPSLKTTAAAAMNYKFTRAAALPEYKVESWFLQLYVKCEAVWVERTKSSDPFECDITRNRIETGFDEYM